MARGGDLQTKATARSRYSDMNPVARERAGAFNEIVRRPGGAVGSLLSAQALAKADAAFQALKPEILGELFEVSSRMLELAEAEEEQAMIFGLAHEVRGLAGSCQRPGAAGVAGAIRAYGMSMEEHAAPDWQLLRLLCAMLYHAVRSTAAVQARAVEETCRRAVTKTMLSEGRTPPQLPW